MPIEDVMPKDQKAHDRDIGVFEDGKQPEGNCIFIARTDSIKGAVAETLELIVENEHNRTMVVVEDDLVRPKEAPRKLRQFAKAMGETPNPGVKEKHHFHGLILMPEPFRKLKEEHFANAKEETDAPEEGTGLPDGDDGDG